MDVARQNAIRIVIWRWYANGIHGVTLRKISPFISKHLVMRERQSIFVLSF